MQGYFQGANAYNNQWYNPQGVQQQQPSSNSVMVVFVEGEAGARSYPVAAGNTVMLMDFNSNKFWLKSTDTTGMPQHLRSFTFKEDTPVAANTNMANVVTREEFDALNQKIDKLINELGGK